MDLEKAKEALEAFTGQAEQLIKDPGKLEELLRQFEAKIKELPVAGDALSRVPLMISMIRSYITREYTAVSPKVIVTLVAAIIYLLKGKDLIPDNIPVVGYADDLAVFAAAFLIDEPELSAYAQWRAENGKAEESIRISAVVLRKDSHRPDISVSLTGASLCTYAIEPLYTKRYARWNARRRDRTGLTHPVLLDGY